MGAIVGDGYGSGTGMDTFTLVDNVGGHPIFHAILANASVSDVLVKIIFELLMVIERKDSVHVQ
jgi:hypothetical protein